MFTTPLPHPQEAEMKEVLWLLVLSKVWKAVIRDFWLTDLIIATPEFSHTMS
jgi:hypothetical protein